MRFLCAALLLLAGVGTAAASIRIDQSHYKDGTLTIVGRTDPNRPVVLDGKYKTTSNADGGFEFAVHEKPFTCMSNIRSGSSIYSAVIAGCLDPGFDGDASTIETLPPMEKAAAKPKH